MKEGTLLQLSDLWPQAKVMSYIDPKKLNRTLVAKRSLPCSFPQEFDLLLWCCPTQYLAGPFSVRAGFVRLPGFGRQDRLVPCENTTLPAQPGLAYSQGQQTHRRLPGTYTHVALGRVRVKG